MLLDERNVVKLFCIKSPSLERCKDGDTPHLNFFQLDMIDTFI